MLDVALKKDGVWGGNQIINLYIKGSTYTCASGLWVEHLVWSTVKKYVKKKKMLKV